jgi:hypothetical protein
VRLNPSSAEVGIVELYLHSFPHKSSWRRAYLYLLPVVAVQLSHYVVNLAQCFVGTRKPKRNIVHAGSNVVIVTSDDEIVSSSFKDHTSTRLSWKCDLVNMTYSGYF